MEITENVNGDEATNKSPVVANTHNEAIVPKHDNKVALVSIGSQFNKLNLFSEKDLLAAENFLTKVMRSDKGGIKSVNDGLAILMRAQDLNLPFSTCIEHVHVINGKTGIDIHIAKALLSKAACTWRCTKDYQALYEYTDGINVYCDGQLPDYAIRCKSKTEADKKREEDKDDEFIYIYPVKWYADFNGNVYKDYQLNVKYHKVVSTKSEAVKLAQQNIVGVYRIPAKPIDYVTEYEITRIVNGKELKSLGRFSYTEAQAANMFDKDTYVKYARILIGHRAWTYAARDIASDILMGVMETTELKIVENVPIKEAEFVEYDEL